MWITECKLCRCPLCIRLSMGLTGTVLPQSSVQLKKSRNYLTLWGFAYIIETMFSKQIKQILYLIRRSRNNENDISAEEKIQSESSRIQSKNEHCRRKKSTCCQKIKRKKKIISIGRRCVAFSSMFVFWKDDRKKEAVWYFQSLWKKTEISRRYISMESRPPTVISLCISIRIRQRGTDLGFRSVKRWAIVWSDTDWPDW